MYDVLLTSTEHVFGQWKEYFQGLLNPTDTCSGEETESGDEGGVTRPCQKASTLMASSLLLVNNVVLSASLVGANLHLIVLVCWS